jgi:hypothetical protein
VIGQRALEFIPRREAKPVGDVSEQRPANVIYKAGRRPSYDSRWVVQQGMESSANLSVDTAVLPEIVAHSGPGF